MKKIPIRRLTPLQHTSTTAEHFKIRRVEEIIGAHDLVQDLHRHDFFFILALEKGVGYHEIDFISYQVNDLTIFFLRPGQVHQLELRTGCNGYLAEFNPEFYNPADKSAKERLRKASSKNCISFEKESFNRIQALLSSLFHEYVAKDEGYADAIRSVLDLFFILYVRQSNSDKSSATITNHYDQQRFEEFIDLVDRHIATRKQVSQYTALMNISAYQLNEITKATVGKTPSQLINEQILLESKRYLLATTNQVKDIADQLGFEDPSYFIRFFRKHVGQSPDAFRHNRNKG